MMSGLIHESFDHDNMYNRANFLPCRYDSCNVGTFPNLTLQNDTGPATAVYSTASKEKYNYQLSVLSGQRLS